MDDNPTWANVNLKTHYFLGGLRMCHTSCLLLDAGPLTDYLSTIKSWLDNNPDQVLTLLLTNGDSRPVSEFGDAITSSELSSYAYTPGSPIAMSQWPTIQELINSMTRIVIFLGIQSRSKGFKGEPIPKSCRLRSKYRRSPFYSRRVRLLLRNPL